MSFVVEVLLRETRGEGAACAGGRDVERRGDGRNAAREIGGILSCGGLWEIAMIS